MDNAERHKHNKHLALKENYSFTAIAFETLGCMSPETKKFIQRSGALLKNTTEKPRSRDFLLQNISVATERGNQRTF